MKGGAWVLVAQGMAEPLNGDGRPDGAVRDEADHWLESVAGRNDG